MAFSTTQKVTIRTYLGFPSRGDEVYDGVENALTAIGDGAEKQAKAEAILAKLATLETSFDAVIPMVGLKSVDKADVVWQDSKSEHPALAGLASLGRRYITQLSILMALPIYCDYFGSQGFPGNLKPGTSSIGIRL